MLYNMASPALEMPDCLIYTMDNVCFVCFDIKGTCATRGSTRTNPGLCWAERPRGRRLG